MRLAVAVAVIVFGTGAAHASTGITSLRIAVRANPSSPWRVARLRCDPPGGTVAQPVTACARLQAAGRAIFAPTPPGTACTQIYGGPQEAIVTGTLDGAKVWVRFRRRDGCEVARWNRVTFLLGPLHI